VNNIGCEHLAGISVIRIGSVVVSYEKGNGTWVLWRVGNFMTG
jgi:hypothetical protein